MDDMPRPIDGSPARFDDLPGRYNLERRLTNDGLETADDERTGIELRTTREDAELPPTKKRPAERAMSAPGSRTNRPASNVLRVAGTAGALASSTGDLAPALRLAARTPSGTRAIVDASLSGPWGPQ